MEINLNKNIHSTRNSRIKNKSNFFEKKTYNNKSKQEKYSEGKNYQIKTENTKYKINKSDNNLINNLMKKKGENNIEFFNYSNLNGKNDGFEAMENFNKEKNNKTLKNNVNYQNNQKQLIKSKSFNNFESTGLNKLENINNLSINIESINNMNIILQCLLNIKKFKDYFDSKKEIITIKKIKNPLAFSFLNIIENIDENKTIKKDALLQFKDYINSINPIPKDLKDLLLFILNSLHNELNEAKNINDNISDGFSKYLNTYFNKYKEYFKNNYNSIIAKLFYLKYNSQTSCLNCDFISNNIQCTNILIFPLEEIIKEYENQNRKAITIYDCFAYYQKQNHKIGTCNKCNKKDCLANNNILCKTQKF